MMWYDEFLNRCLDGLPKDKYRNRAKAELEDHLLSLCEELEAAGDSPEEARAMAVELMGDADALNRSFRAEWVRRASNWKYCLGAFCKAGAHAALINSIAHWILLIPMLSILDYDVFDGLIAGSPVAASLLVVVNFLPGLWFSARELHERFSAHPRRKLLLLCGFLMVWMLEAVPLNISCAPTPSGFAYLLYELVILLLCPLLLGQIPLIFMCWETPYSAAYALRPYHLAALILSILFALFYRPKHEKPFLLSDKT